MMKIEIGQEAFKNIQEKLNKIGKKSNTVLKKSLNAAAKAGEKEVIKQLKKNYTIKQALLKGSTSTKKASVKDLTSTIKIKSNAVPARKGFQTRKNTKKLAARLKVFQNGGFKPLELQGRKAFFAEMKSEHKGIFQRVPGSRAGNGREKIKEIYGPSIPSMAGSKKVYQKLEKEIQNNLNEQLEKFIAQALEE